MIANMVSNKEPEVPMDTENTATVLKDTVTVTSQSDQGGVKPPTI